MSIHVLIAPQGIGKTRYAGFIQKRLGASHVVDDYDGRENLCDGALALTNNADVDIAERLKKRGYNVIEAKTQADLLKLIAGNAKGR